jgi:copper resistance protein C
MVDAKNAKHMTLALPKLAPGVYTVQWMSSALDGHKLARSYSFTVK